MAVPKEKIAVVLPNHLGDVVMATPALRALRRGRPGAEIRAVVRSSLAGVLRGAPWIDAFTTHDIYAAKDLPRVPYTLSQATETFVKSDFAKRAFGEEVVEHYSHFYRTEAAAYDKAVTDWERARYFERI